MQPPYELVDVLERSRVQDFANVIAAQIQAHQESEAIPARIENPIEQFRVEVKTLYVGPFVLDYVLE